MTSKFSLIKSLRWLLRDDSGSIAVTLGVLMPVVAAGAAFGVETSFWYYKDLQLQAAADASAYAGAVEKRSGSSKDKIHDAAVAIGTANGFVQANGAATVNSPPLSGTHKTTRSVEVILQDTEPRFFSSLFIQTPVIVRARAVATYQDAGSACILALSTSASKAALFSGSSTSKFTDCSIMANSLASDAVTVQGSGKLETSCIYSAGGVSLGSGTTLKGCTSANTHVPPVGDPYGDLPQPTAAGTCNSTSGSPLQPGTYCGGMTLGGTKALAPGLYVVTGGNFKINANANISGSGVTIYLTGGARVSINGTATVNLSAPTTGTYAGILFFGDRSDSGATKNNFNGTASSQLTGAIYFASQTVQFLGNFSGADGCTQVVGLTVEWSGNANVAKDCSKYGMRDIPAVQLVRLVE
jgi:hypothetical protein